MTYEDEKKELTAQMSGRVSALRGMFSNHGKAPETADKKAAHDIYLNRRLAFKEKKTKAVNASFKGSITSMENEALRRTRALEEADRKARGETLRSYSRAASSKTLLDYKVEEEKRRVEEDRRIAQESKDMIAKAALQVHHDAVYELAQKRQLEERRIAQESREMLSKAGNAVHHDAIYEFAQKQKAAELQAAKQAKESLLQFSRTHVTYEDEQREEKKRKEEAAKLKHAAMSKTSSVPHHDAIYEFAQKQKAAELQAAKQAKESLLQFSRTHVTYEDEKREELKRKEEAAREKKKNKSSFQPTATHHDPIYNHAQKRLAEEREAAQAAKNSLLQFTKSHRTFEEEKRDEMKRKEEAAKLKHEQKLSKSASSEGYDPIYAHIQKRKAAEKEAELAAKASLLQFSKTHVSFEDEQREEKKRAEEARRLKKESMLSKSAKSKSFVVPHDPVYAHAQKLKAAERQAAEEAKQSLLQFSRSGTSYADQQRELLKQRDELLKQKELESKTLYAKPTASAVVFDPIYAHAQKAKEQERKASLEAKRSLQRFSSTKSFFDEQLDKRKEVDTKTKRHMLETSRSMRGIVIPSDDDEDAVSSTETKSRGLTKSFSMRPTTSSSKAGGLASSGNYPYATGAKREYTPSPEKLKALARFQNQLAEARAREEQKERAAIDLKSRILDEDRLQAEAIMASLAEEADDDQLANTSSMVEDDHLQSVAATKELFNPAPINRDAIPALSIKGGKRLTAGSEEEAFSFPSRGLDSPSTQTSEPDDDLSLQGAEVAALMRKTLLTRSASSLSRHDLHVQKLYEQNLLDKDIEKDAKDSMNLTSTSMSRRDAFQQQIQAEEKAERLNETTTRQNMARNAYMGTAAWGPDDFSDISNSDSESESQEKSGKGSQNVKESSVNAGSDAPADTITNESVTVGPAQVQNVEQESLEKLEEREQGELAQEESLALANAEQENLEKEKLAQEEALVQEKIEQEKRAQEEALAQEKIEQEKRAHEEALALAKLEQEKRDHEEALAKEKLEQEKRAHEEALAQEKLEQEKRAHEEALAQEKLEQEKRAQEEALALAKAKEQVEQEKLEQEKRAHEEALALAKLEQEKRAQEEALALAKAKEQVEQERLEQEKRDLKKQEEALALEKAKEQVRLEQERLERETALALQKQEESLALERAKEQVKLEQERLERENAMALKEKEDLALEKAKAQVKLEQERLENEKASSNNVTESLIETSKNNSENFVQNTVDNIPQNRDQRSYSTPVPANLPPPRPSSVSVDESSKYQKDMDDQSETFSEYGSAYEYSSGGRGSRTSSNASLGRGVNGESFMSLTNENDSFIEDLVAEYQMQQLDETSELSFDAPTSETKPSLGDALNEAAPLSSTSSKGKSRFSSLSERAASAMAGAPSRISLKWNKNGSTTASPTAKDSSSAA